MTPIEFGYAMGQRVKFANPEYNGKDNLSEALHMDPATFGGLGAAVGAAGGGLAGAGLGGIAGMFGEVEPDDTRLRKILRRAGLGALAGGAVGGAGLGGMGAGISGGMNAGVHIGNQVGRIEGAENPSLIFGNALRHVLPGK